jgi:23S rRNA pseudouridine1911/1915/1917 synthase
MRTSKHQETAIIDVNHNNMRIDKAAAALIPSFPRSKTAEASTLFYQNGKAVKKSKKIVTGDTIMVVWEHSWFAGIEGQEIPLTILYEDSDLLVIDKKQSMVVHPAVGNWSGTVVHALVHRYGDSFFQEEENKEQEASDDEISLRPGIVHRLDKETSGVMVIALHRQSHLHLSAQFKERQVEKYYIALVDGDVKEAKGTIETLLVRQRRNRKLFTVAKTGKGKMARTEYEVLKRYPGCTLMRIHLITGRTHQIRVHMRHIGHPVVGDSLYAHKRSPFVDQQLMLHALSLQLIHPTSKVVMRFTSPLPQRFKTLLATLR